MFEKQLKENWGSHKRCVAIDIKEWFCKQNGIKGKTHIVAIKKETEKAVLVNFCFDYYIDMWMPKSCVSLTPQYQFTEEEKKELHKEWLKFGKDITELNKILEE
jgi:hypothetical protein